MIIFSVKTDIAKVADSLNSVARKQMPFAIAKGLTATAKEVQTKLTDALPKQLDRPTPFTMRAFGITPATKAVPIATVFVKPDQLKYLQYQIDGGARAPGRRALVVPKNVRLNQYGNMPKAMIKRLLAKPGVFSGKVDGVPGIYQRKGNKVTLLVAYQDRARYKKRYPFAEIGERAVVKGFERLLGRSIEEALATMK